MNHRTPAYVDNPDDPRWLVRLAEGLRAVTNRDARVAATCPFCGGGPPAEARRPEDDRIRYVDTIETYRGVVLGPEGGLRADDGYHTGDGYDDGKERPVFECHHEATDPRSGRTQWCGGRWAVPRWLDAQIEWKHIGRTMRVWE